MRNPAIRSLVYLTLFLTLMTTPAAAQTWSELAPAGPVPSGRLSAPAVYNPASNRLVLFGGYPLNTPGDQNAQNDVWILTAANGIGTPTWVQMIPSFAPGSPAPRFAYASAYDQATNRMIIFGGADFNQLYDDVWVLRDADGSAGTPSWEQLAPSGTPPTARNHHSAVYDSGTNRLIVFGGFSTVSCSCDLLNDVWVLTNANGAAPETPAWVQLTPSGTLPDPRSDFVAGYDPATNRMIITGGVAAPSLGVVLTDTWVLHNANGVGEPSWEALAATGAPDALGYASGTYDPATNRLIVFGGLAIPSSGDSPASNDTWILGNANGSGGPAVWQRLTVPGTLPVGRDTAIAAYDPSTARLIVFSGEDHPIHVTLNDTWVLTGANGRPVADAGADQIVTVTSGTVAPVTLSGSGTSPIGLAVTYAWTEGATLLSTSPVATVTLPLGLHTLKLTVTDSNGDSTFDTTVVSVQMGGTPGPAGPAGPQGPQGPIGPPGPAGSQTWSTFIPQFGSTYKAAVFTPDTAITVTRIELQLGTAPSGCSVNARVRLTDGTTAHTLTVNNAHENSGTLAIDYAAGATVSVHVNRAAACAGATAPANANIVVQYKAR